MTAPRLPKQVIALGVFVYGSLIAALVAFVVFRRQGIVEGSLVDLNGFGSIARHLARGDGFSLGLGPTIRRGPLYPFFGAALIALFSHDVPGISQSDLFLPILVANCAIFGIVCVVIWSMATRLFGPRVGFLAAALCPLVPQSLRYVGMTEVETLMSLFIALLAVLGTKLVSRPSPAIGAAFGATAAAASLTKAIALLYPFVFLPLALWHWKKTGMPRKPGLIASGTALVCFVVLLIPWSLRNMSVTDGAFKGISSNGPAEFLRGYVNVQPKYFLLRQDFGGTSPGEKWDPEANAAEMALLQPQGMQFYRAVVDSSGKATFDPLPPPGVTNSALLDVRKDQIESAEVKRKVIGDPLGFVRKFVIQLFMFWYVVETRKKSVLVGGIALVALGFAIAGWVRARRRGVLIWPIVAAVVYFNVIYAIFLAFARYSMPLFPTITAFAAGGVGWALERVLGAKLFVDAPQDGKS